MLKNCTLLTRRFICLKPILLNKLHFKHSATFINLLKNLPQTQCSQLENGLTVATEERQSCNTCIGLYIDAGSRYESKSQNGITHFMEHVAFKSTKSRNTAVLENLILTTGAKFQCFTTREMTAYFVECLSSDVPLVFDILLDCIFNNALNYSVIESEKQIVCSEMFEHERNIKNILFDYLHLSAFQGTPLEQTVMGPSNNIFKFNAKLLCKLIYERFTPEKMVLTAIGGINHHQIQDLANKYLSKLVNVKVDESNKFRYTGSDIRYRDDSQPMAHVAIAFEGPSFSHDDYTIMELASAVVGGWDKSQLGGLGHGTRVARAASYEGLCDAYKSFYISYKDTALWGAYFIAPRLTLDDMVFVVQDEWMRLCTMITDEEIERAKNQLKTNLLSKSASVVETSHKIGRSILYRTCILPLYEAIMDIDNISSNDIKAVCYKYLYDKCPVVAAVGPTEALTDYSRIRSNTYWLRL
ncbi:unnamed protein product [Parnassius mnemosyne]|uniref:Mitochondrial processing peptidase beta subunit n=1 Tax=Parnassius mnemosyne TaxID=213953 RepID=A0AAV1L124_9NEOP